ncbi:MAG: tRNA-dihydrouridine synthase [Methyloligellaceae bacterium]
MTVGLGARGRPWLPGRAAALLDSGRDPGPPSLCEQKELALEHYEDTVSHYGRELGVRTARKHLGWYVETTARNPRDVKPWRQRLCREGDPEQVKAGLAVFFDQQLEAAA